MNIMKQQETTLVQRACAKVTGFKKLHKQLEKKIIVSGKSLSTLNNYMRCIAHIALHFYTRPSRLDIEQIEEYLLMVKKRNTTSSESFFKHTVYGLRFLFRCEGRDARAILLPTIKRDNKLPVVLSPGEMKLLLKTPELLKHRVLLGVLYGCGLRCHEARSLMIKDVDFERNMLHVRQGVGRKDRYFPIGENRCRGIKASYPQKFRTNGSSMEKINMKVFRTERLGYNPDACPVCKQLTMITIFNFDRRGPPGPEMMKDLIQKYQSKQAS